MKKSLTVIFAVLFAASSMAQDGNLKKQFYLRAGYSLPGWKYYGFDGKTDWPTTTFSDPKRVGGAFELGSIYMLNGIHLMNGMRLGINVDYLSVAVQKFSFSNTDASTTFIYVGSKIGPSFSYSPVKRLVFDTYVKFNPVWASLNQEKFMGIDEDTFYGGYMGIKYSVGLNVRYSVLMMGVEYNPGFVKLKYWNKDDNKFDNIYLGNTDNDKDKTPVPGMNFWLGLSF